MNFLKDFLVITSRSCFGLINLHFSLTPELRRRLLYQLLTKAVDTSILLEPNQMKLDFVIINDKASYAAYAEVFFCLELPEKPQLSVNGVGLTKPLTTAF